MKNVKHAHRRCGTSVFLSFVEIPSQTGEPKTIGDYFEEQGKLEAIASGRLALPEPKE